MNKILFREHRGSLKESLETMKSFDNKEALLEYLKNILPICFGCSIENNLICEHYCYDERTEWETYILKVKTPYNNPVIGFTNCQILATKNPRLSEG